jgi:hypothetical protein
VAELLSSSPRRGAPQEPNAGGQAG